MKPDQLLSLWRERWGKPGAAGLQVPYVEGKAATWSKQLAEASMLSFTAVRLALGLVCLSAIALIVSIRFSLHDQVVVSVFLACSGLLLRRYAGTPVTLILAVLSLVASLRYLTWRLEDTLVPATNLEFVLGFTLCIAEGYLVLQWAVEFVRITWPLKRNPVALSGARATWPSVDVFILGHGCSLSAKREAMHRAAALDWTKSRLKTYLLDDAEDADARALSASVPTEYIVGRDNDMVADIRLAMQKSNGELIVVVDCDYPLAPVFLSNVAGWFTSDQRFGMLTTPRHVLAPPAADGSMRHCEEAAVPGTCAVLRRSALVNAWSAAHESDAVPASTARSMIEKEFGVSYLISGPDQIARLDNPFSPAALWWKKQVMKLEEVLRFYSLFPRVVFLTAPLAYLLLDARLIHASVEPLAAFAIPHLLHAYFLRTRLEPKRFKLWTELREGLLACYLLIPTTFNLILTGSKRLMYRLYLRSEHDQRLANEYNLVPCAIVVALNLAGLVTGAFRVPLLPETECGMAILYLLWCTGNLLLMASMLAVAGEAMQVQQYVRARAVLPAMVRLPYGRTVSCMTVNFPQPDLTLELPVPAEAGPGAELTVSIFFQHRDFTFPARVTSNVEQKLQVLIEESERLNYKAFGAGVLSRGQDWPKWLAGRNAGQFVPPWIINGMKSMAISILDFFTNIGQHTSWLRLNIRKNPTVEEKK
jgi:cellulose synthase (UDP-forming)